MRMCAPASPETRLFVELPQLRMALGEGAVIFGLGLRSPRSVIHGLQPFECTVKA
jgi:hypothetical protein